MMTKLMATAILVLMCAPALADTPPTPAPPLAQLNLQVTITDGKVTRTHQLFTVGDDCSEIADLQFDHDDEVHACARPTGGAIEVHVEWKSRTGLDTAHAITSHGKSSLLVAHGVSYPISRGAVSVSLLVR